MSKIFVSYSRQSQDMARTLVNDIQALGYAVWFDQDLSGGHAWWEQILAIIRDSDIFVFLLDPEGLKSVAWERELSYASALGKPVLPVLVAAGVSTNLLRPELSRIQFIDYRKQDRQSALALGRALASVPPSSALPDPLPAPPEVPVSYLGGLSQIVEKAPSLSYEEQSVMVLDLRRGLRDPKSADDTRVLLGKLRGRRDVFAAIAEEIDELLGGPRAAKPGLQDRPAPVAAPRETAGQSTPDVATDRRLRYFLIPALVVIAGIGYFVYARIGSSVVPGGSPKSERGNQDAGSAAATGTVAAPASDDYWTDPGTRLMWTRQDTVTRPPTSQAGAVLYCENLRLGGYADWRLPTIEQLAAMHDSPTNDFENIRIHSPLQWSSSAGSKPGQAWYFNFAKGSRIAGDSSYDLQALCVRGAENPRSDAGSQSNIGEGPVPHSQ